ncbi:hypothetical protein [Blastococcus litoris]|uniref:hypothetical protein n=1 Tax=Blastococcus litoris TaxID=2171622 RepID=UPI000E3060B5|nr:hypothetical protein [Blastococcus litoris]
MTYPSDPAAPAPQPGTRDGAWAPPQGAGPTAPYAEPQQSSGKKWLKIGAPIVGAGIVGFGALGLFGAGDPEVGDCVRMVSDTEFESADCASDEAEFKVVGIDEQEMTRSEFDAASVEDICVDFASTEVALWIGDMVTDPGTIYCAAGV